VAGPRPSPPRSLGSPRRFASSRSRECRALVEPRGRARRGSRLIDWGGGPKRQRLRRLNCDQVRPHGRKRGHNQGQLASASPPPPRTSSAASDAAGSIGPLTSPPRDGNGDPIPNSPRGIRPLGDGDASILISHGELFGEKLIPVGYGGGGDVPALPVPVSPQPRLKRPGPIKNSP
jgi:hypothetical protein